MSPQQMNGDRHRKKFEGLDFEEELTMAYENIQSEAKHGCKGVKRITGTEL